MGGDRIRVFTAFSGYDSQLLALERLKRAFPDFEYECVGWCEIDKYAIRAHNALFPDLADRNYGDISKIDWEKVPDFDLFTMSSPCQDFSTAGLHKGGEEGSGTRSSLLWECRKAIVVKRPKYILFENVKNLVSQTFLPSFLKWQDELASYGYSNFAKVLNAKDYGVPQNRERIFMVSILDFDGVYHFPKKIPLTLCLRDVLEDEPSNKYYLSDRAVEGYLRINERLGEHSLWRFRVTDKDGPARPILTVSGTNLNFVQDDNMTDKIEYMGNCYPERRGGEAEAQEGMVYGTGGVSPSIVATSYKGTMPKIITDDMQDKQVTACAIRGRGESGSLHQTLELGGHVANAVTTSHKNSMVIEIGNIYPATGNPQAGRIYDERGISPALDTMEGGNRQPKILADNTEQKHKYSTQKNAFHGSVDVMGSRQPVMLTSRRTEYGKAVRKDYESGALRGRRSDMTELTPRGDGCSNTLTSVRKDNLLLERKPKYRIRRLTERECFRLMDVDEKDIDTIQAAGISATQQYRMAGNSIVVACLYHIFRKMFVEKENEERQTRLF